MLLKNTQKIVVFEKKKKNTIESKITEMGLDSPPRPLMDPPFFN